MKGSEVVQSHRATRWVLGLALAAWLGLAAAWGHHARLQAENVPLWTPHTRSAVFDLAWEFGAALLTRTLLFVPLACFLALLLAARPARPARTWLLAVSLSCCVAAPLIALRCWPLMAGLGAYNLVLPGVGALIGASAGLAWTLGRKAQWCFIIGAAVAVAALAAISALSLSLMLEPEPLALRAQVVSADEKRQLYDLFAEKNPLKIEPGRTVTIELKQRDVNALLAIGLSVGHTARMGEVQLEAGRATLRATSPLSSRFLNVTARGGVQLGAGQLRIYAERLRVGRLEIPRIVLRLASPLVSRAISEDVRVKPVLRLLQGLELKTNALTMTYGHGRLPDGFVASLFHDGATLSLDIPGIKAQLRNLIGGAHEMPLEREALARAAIETAFRFASLRSTPERAVIENRNALLALAILLGHPRVEALIGDLMDPASRAAAKRAFDGTTLRHREDWTKHFFVSAALTIISAGRLSNATGLFKEEKDSGGGSGFSFGDLLADRAGTTFAEFATHDERSARALQVRVSRGFRLEDFFPAPDGLPENLQDAEFQTLYGGVGGKGYLRLKAEIERRISNCAAYKEL